MHIWNETAKTEAHLLRHLALFVVLGEPADELEELLALFARDAARGRHAGHKLAVGRSPRALDQFEQMVELLAAEVPSELREQFVHVLHDRFVLPCTQSFEYEYV